MSALGRIRTLRQRQSRKRGRLDSLQPAVNGPTTSSIRLFFSGSSSRLRVPMAARRLRACTGMAPSERTQAHPLSFAGVNLTTTGRLTSMPIAKQLDAGGVRSSSTPDLEAALRSSSRTYRASHSPRPHRGRCRTSMRGSRYCRQRNPDEGSHRARRVGVDLVCGVDAVQLSLTAKDLPVNLGSLRSAIEAAVTVGFEMHAWAKGQAAHANPPRNASARLANPGAHHPTIARCRRIPRNVDSDRWELSAGATLSSRSASTRRACLGDASLGLPRNRKRDRRFLHRRARREMEKADIHSPIGIWPARRGNPSVRGSTSRR